MKNLALKWLEKVGENCEKSEEKKETSMCAGSERAKK